MTTTIIRDEWQQLVREQFIIGVRYQIIELNTPRTTKYTKSLFYIELLNMSHQFWKAVLNVGLLAYM